MEDCKSEVEKHFVERVVTESGVRWLYVDFRELQWLASGLRLEWYFDQRVWDVLKTLSLFAREQRFQIFIDFRFLNPTREGESYKASFLEFPNDAGVIMWGVTVQMRDYLLALKSEVPSNGPLPDSPGSFYAAWRTKTHFDVGLADKLRAFEHRNIEKLVHGAYMPFKKDSLAGMLPLRSHEGDDATAMLRSTPIKASGIYNSQRLIGTPSSFMRVAVALADRCSEAITELSCSIEEPEEVRLLALSPRAAPFTGALSLLCNLRFNIVTPTSSTRLLVDYANDKFRARAKYIYVADFVLGGTELRIAEVHALHWGSTVTHCICIGTYLKSGSYRRNNPPKILPLVDNLASNLKDKKGAVFELAE